MKAEIYHTEEEVIKDVCRKGKCNPQKCKAICCRFIHLGPVYGAQKKKFLEGFGFKIVKMNGQDHVILERNCDYLDLKTFKCKRYKTRPAACRHFPTPNDTHWQVIAKKCTFSFPEKRKEKMSL